MLFRSDSAIYDMISTGKCDGIFQLESPGMKSFMKDLKPQNLEDIIAGISLYRPGPMDFIPKYIEGKRKHGDVDYECEELRPILEPTYGCFVYQEQVMQIVRDLAGYSYGRSDLVRRAMSKKKASVMEKERQNFVYGNEAEGVKGCVKNGISVEVAMKIFDEMTEFARYAFNKSHAAAYAMVSYQTAYLKCHFPIEFMAALMTSVIDRTDKVAGYIMSCRQMGIQVLPPSIQDGFASFSTCEQGIRYGLSAIKSIGRPVIDAIIEERKQGDFLELSDFIKRIASKSVNKRAIENLIKAGALDDFPGNRKQKMLIYTKLVDDTNSDRKSNLIGQMSLFEYAAPEESDVFLVKFPDVEEYKKEEILAFEKEVLGIYVSGHPMEQYEAMWRKTVTRTCADFIPDDEEENAEPLVRDDEKAIIGGIVIDKVVKTTKTNQLMEFVTIEDLYGVVEVILFPRDFEKNKQSIDLDRKVFLKGKVTIEEGRPAKLIANAVIPFDEMPRELWIQLTDMEHYNESETYINQVIHPFDGNSNVIIYLAKEKKIKRLPHSKNVSINEELLLELYGKFGENNVKVKEKQIEKD